MMCQVGLNGLKNYLPKPNLRLKKKKFQPANPRCEVASIFSSCWVQYAPQYTLYQTSKLISYLPKKNLGPRDRVYERRRSSQSGRLQELKSNGCFSFFWLSGEPKPNIQKMQKEANSLSWKKLRRYSVGLSLFIKEILDCGFFFSPLEVIVSHV